MMVSEANHQPSQYPYQQCLPTSALDVPQWSSHDEPSPHSNFFFALSRFLPSNVVDSYDDDHYSSDDFRIYEFKVRRCTRGRSHDWTECPYAHPGEKARRRDPRKYQYSGTACPDFRKGSCKKGDACELAHGVFECWLHPARYRTQPCKDGINCRRRVCFFAHTTEQLRIVPSGAQRSPRTASDSYDGSPARQQHHPSLEAFFPKSMLTNASSPTSILTSPPLSPPSPSPPLSPSQPAARRAALPVGSNVNDVLASLRQLHLSKWGSPRGRAMANNGFCSLPIGGGAGGLFDGWDGPVERVESGRDLRAKIAEKLSKENCVVERPDDGSAPALPDVGWVCDLVN